MHPHFCGNWIHDLVHNTMVLLTMVPDWVPAIRMWSLNRLALRTRGTVNTDAETSK